MSLDLKSKPHGIESFHMTSRWPYHCPKTEAMLVSQTSPLGVEFFSYATTFFSSKSAYMLATWVKTLYHALYWKLGGLFTLYSWVKRISVFDSEKSYFTLYANWNDCARSSKRLILTFDMTFVQSKLFIEVRWFSFRK